MGGEVGRTTPTGRGVKQLAPKGVCGVRGVIGVNGVIGGIPLSKERKHFIIKNLINSQNNEDNILTEK